MSAARPRLGVVITELGLASEIWAPRQAAAMTRFDPLMLAWGRHAGSAPVEALAEQHFPGPFPGRARGLAGRLAAKAGLARARMPDARAAASIRETLLEAGVAGVLCHFLWTAIPVTAALGGRLPVVAIAHGRDASAMLAHRDYRAALRHTLPRLAGLVTVGQFQRAALGPFGLPERAATIPMGAPVALFGAAPLPERAEGAALRIVSVGRLSPEKGVEELLDAFGQLLETGHRAELLYIGDGPLEARLRTRIAAPPFAGRVRLAGRLTPGVIARELSGAHLLVQASRPAGGWIEGFGVTLAEAGAAGLALVASEFGGIPDQIRHGENGLLVPPGDVGALAQAMARLADDEALRRNMGQAARRIAAGFDSDLMTARLEGFLAEAFATHPGGDAGGRHG